MWNENACYRPIWNDRFPADDTILKGCRKELEGCRRRWSLARRIGSLGNAFLKVPGHFFSWSLLPGLPWSGQLSPVICPCWRHNVLSKFLGPSDNVMTPLKLWAENKYPCPNFFFHLFWSLQYSNYLVQSRNWKMWKEPVLFLEKRRFLLFVFKYRSWNLPP